MKPKSTENITLKIVMDTVHDGIIIINNKGIIEHSNKAAEKIFGYEQNDVVGKNVNLLMPIQTANQHDKYISNYQATKIPRIIGVGREVMGKRKNGDEFPLELAVNEMRVDGETKYVGTIRDHSQQRALEDKMNETIKNLEISNQDFEDLFYIATHDLKQPLRGMNTQLQFFFEDFEGKIDEHVLAQLRPLQKLSSNLEKVLEDIIALVRLKDRALRPREFKLQELFVETVQQASERFSVAITSSIGDIQNPIVADRELFHELLTNIIENAIEFNDSDEKIIHLGSVVSNQSHKRHFYIHDNGGGIDIQQREVVFKAFKKIHKKQFDTQKTGIGLTKAKNIINKHGGDIWIESGENGVGTAVHFTISNHV